MTIREIITKLETENNTLSDENRNLKKEIQEVRNRNFGIERELKSLKKLLEADNAIIVHPEVIEPEVVEPEVVEPEILVEPVKKKTKKKISK